MNPLLLAVIGAALGPAAVPLHAAYIAGLDGVGLSSTLEANVIAPLTDVGGHGWTDIAGAARFFDTGDGYNGRIINSTDPYGNYTVQYAPLVDAFYEANTVYTLTFQMGYTAGNPNGVSEYSFSLGTLGAGGFTPLATQEGVSVYPGANVFLPDSVVFATGAIPPAERLAIQWSQTFSSAAPASSDWLGFDLVTLDASPVPEPSVALLAALAGGAWSLRARRRGRR